MKTAATLAALLVGFGSEDVGKKLQWSLRMRTLARQTTESTPSDLTARPMPHCRGYIVSEPLFTLPWATAAAGVPGGSPPPEAVDGIHGPPKAVDGIHGPPKAVDGLGLGLMGVTAVAVGLGSSALMLLLAVLALCLCHQQSSDSSPVSPAKERQRSPLAMKRRKSLGSYLILALAGSSRVVPPKERKRSHRAMNRRMSLFWSYLILALAAGPASCEGPEPNLRRAGPDASHIETDEAIPTTAIDDTSVKHEMNLLRKIPGDEDAALASDPFIYQVVSNLL